MSQIDFTKQDLAHVVSGLTREAETYKERAGKIIVRTDLDLQMKHQFLEMVKKVNDIIDKIKNEEGHSSWLDLHFNLCIENAKPQ